jgi:ubiquinone/menaquinone biosynthesis C-methylase UbiE
MSGAAADFDRRWRRYNARSLALLRPWVEGRALGRVLDVGCGTANLLPRLGAWGARADAYAGVDPSLDMLRAGGGKVAASPLPAALVSAVAGALPLADASFDTAVTASSLHFWPDPVGGLREIRRVLRPGGTLLLLDWDAAPLPMRLLGAWMRLRRIDHGNVLTASETEALLRGAGFRVGASTRGSAGGLWRLAGFRAVAG